MSGKHIHFFAEEMETEEESMWKSKIYILVEKNTEKEKVTNIWRRKIYFLWRERKLRRKRRKIFGKGEYAFCGGE